MAIVALYVSGIMLCGFSLVQIFAGQDNFENAVLGLLFIILAMIAEREKRDGKD